MRTLASICPLSPNRVLTHRSKKLVSHVVGGRTPREFAERALWNIDSGSASVHFDVEGADHLAPLLGFVSDELCEVGGRARQRLTEVSQTDLHLGVGEGRVDLLVELLDDLGWRVPGNADAIPRCRLVARHEFSHSGDIRYRLRARRGRYR